jgi:hypothetical protein
VLLNLLFHPGDHSVLHLCGGIVATEHPFDVLRGFLGRDHLLDNRALFVLWQRFEKVRHRFYLGDAEEVINVLIPPCG